MKKRGPILLVLITGLLLLFTALPVQAGILTFNSQHDDVNANSDVQSTRNNWLSSIGIVQPQYLVNFETGFTEGQNISGLPNLFPGSLVISDTSSAHKAMISGLSTNFGGSYPIGTFAVAHNEAAYLELDFSASPVDYVALRDIDHSGTDIYITFVGSTDRFKIPPTMGGNYTIETTGTAGVTAEFFGIYRNDRPRIAKVELDATGDGEWGIDNIEYGVKGVPQVPEPLTIILLGAGMAGLAVMRKRNE